MEEEVIVSGPTWLSLLPPLITIIIAFLSRRIIISLFFGILSGAFIAAEYNLVAAGKKTALVIWDKIELANLQSLEAFNNSWNLFILLFCILLGTLIGMFYRTGGASAYGRWALNRIKSRRGASLATMFLGWIIFFDDYFNCLTVGAVMRPVTDQFKISRAKLAYLIDSTTAPICILAPVSTWVVEVINQLRIAGVKEPFELFMKAIIFNTYSWLAIFLVFLVSISRRDFGPMKSIELRALIDGELGAIEMDPDDPKYSVFRHDDSKIAYMRDLAIPLIIFIMLCIGFMFYTGNATIFGGKNSLLIALQKMHLAKSLFWGGLLGVILALFYYLARKLLTLREAGEIFFKSIKIMFPVVLTLLFAWSLGAIISQDLQTGVYLATLFKDSLTIAYLPVIIFFVSCLVSFSTGTSWGTFAIMIPIAVPLAQTLAPELMIPMIGALLAGAIFGDHASPISDTTILSSVGAGCEHMDHVITQVPYSILVAFSCCGGFLTSGFMINIGLMPTGILSMLISLIILTTLFFLITKKPLKYA
jgi:tetracycline resistance efflux pump